MVSVEGGFSYGIKEVFGDQAECIGHSEVDKYAIEVYRRRYPTHPALGEVCSFELISDTQRYKMLGNSVTTNVITQIMTKFKEVHYDQGS